MKRKIISVLLALVLVLNFGLVIEPPVVTAQSTINWTAYNDCNFVDGDLDQNITKISVSGTTSGSLIRRSGGAETPVTAAFTKNGDITLTVNGVNALMGTDAYDTFNDDVSCSGVVNSSVSGWWVDLTLSGLDPAKSYTFAGTAIRGGSTTTYYNRNSTFILSGDEGAINTSTSGAVAIDSHTIAFNTGSNHNEGYVVRWTDIDPGSDGTIVIRSRASNTSEISGSTANAYGLSVFMLQEREPAEPRIIISNTSLDAFKTMPGETSSEQIYTVSGINLTDSIEITAPDGFEISSASGSGFGSSLSLTPSGGTVIATDIFVRFSRTDEGTFTGNITHTSTGAAAKTVAVSGTAVLPGTWTAYNDCAYIDGQISTNITTYEAYTSGESGLLKKYADGSDTPVTVTVTTGGSVASQLTEDRVGAEPDSGTDAYDTFHDYVNMVGGVRLGSDAYIDMAFTGLNQNYTYTFAATANLANSEYADRITRFTISDIEAAVNGSTSGVTVSSNESVSFCTGYNTINGYIARWTGIQPGDDGDFTVRFEIESGEYTYGPAVFLLSNETPSPVNHAPDQPSPVYPADGSNDISVMPTLTVNVSDPDPDDLLDVTFYGREVGTTAPGPDFTLVAIPDTQMAAENYPAVFDSQMQWIADNKDDLNIVFATSLGDIVNRADDETQWNTADAAYSKLEEEPEEGEADRRVPYSVAPGNHDLPLAPLWTTTLYPDYFGPERFAGKSWQGWEGSFEDNNYDNYSLFSASGMDFIIVNLRYQAGTDVLNWADTVLKANSSRRAIVVQHDILNVNDSWSNQATFNALKDNANLFLMLCGHNHASGDGAAYRAEQGDNGQTIHIMLADYQDFPNGGNGYLRLLRFSPADNTIYATTY
ncbi:MAG: metallophosphoesterase, partial [Dehalococcoidales bacterium]|nr:metallophosphoesterase [Dehalococcoidales bacterium]